MVKDPVYSETISGRLLMDGLQHTDTGQATVSILKSRDRFRRSWTLRTSTTPLSSNIIAEINFDDNKLHLTLTRIHYLETPTKVFCSRNGMLTESSVRHSQEFNLYQDVNNSASIILHKKPSHNNELSENTTYMEGYFRFNGSMYYIAPASGHFHHKGQGYLVTRLNQSLTFDPDLTSGVHRHKFLKKTRSKRETTVVPYEVELMIVTDYSMYQFWLNVTEDERRAEVLLQNYISSLINSMDSRYRSIKEEDMSFGVLFSGLYMAKTAEDSFWTERHKAMSILKGRKSTVNASAALTNFTEWFESEPKLKIYDHVMLLTSYDLIGQGNLGYQLLGLANVGGICSSRTSVVENSFNFIGALTSAHELGHSLGAVHDGDSNTCDGSDGYTMAASLHLGGMNPWLFSSCSIDSFRETVNRLNSEKANCLTVKTSLPYPVPSDKPLLGSQYDWTRQCQLSLGDGFAVYKRQASGTLCNKLQCLQQKKSQVTSIIPLPGTSCGNKKWCVQGECVTDPLAAAANDDCLFGDPAEYCQGSQFTRQHCYINANAESCCQTCSQIKNISTADCPYGDRPGPIKCSSIQLCQCLNVTVSLECCETCSSLPTLTANDCTCYDQRPDCEPFYCYEEPLRNQCCQTCTQKHNQMVTEHGDSCKECPFGDREPFSSCQPLLNSKTLCYTNNNYIPCCETCCSVKNNSECEYGDKTNCGELVNDPQPCYDDDIYKQCCGTCDQLKTKGLPGCEYGEDRVCAARVNGSPALCYSNFVSCCESCLAVIDCKSPDCEFGDRLRGCTALNCMSEEQRHGCCETCALKSSNFSSTIIAQACQRLDFDFNGTIPTITERFTSSLTTPSTASISKATIRTSATAGVKEVNTTTPEINPEITSSSTSRAATIMNSGAFETDKTSLKFVTNIHTASSSPITSTALDVGPSASDNTSAKTSNSDTLASSRGVYPHSPSTSSTSKAISSTSNGITSSRGASFPSPTVFDTTTARSSSSDSRRTSQSSPSIPDITTTLNTIAFSRRASTSSSSPSRTSTARRSTSDAIVSSRRISYSSPLVSDTTTDSLSSFRATAISLTSSDIINTVSSTSKASNAISDSNAIRASTKTSHSANATRLTSKATTSNSRISYSSLSFSGSITANPLSSDPKASVPVTSDVEATNKRITISPFPSGVFTTPTSTSKPLTLPPSARDNLSHSKITPNVSSNNRPRTSVTSSSPEASIDLSSPTNTIILSKTISTDLKKSAMTPVTTKSTTRRKPSTNSKETSSTRQPDSQPLLEIPWIAVISIAICIVLLPILVVICLCCLTRMDKSGINTNKVFFLFGKDFVNNRLKTPSC